MAKSARAFQMPVEDQEEAQPLVVEAGDIITHKAIEAPIVSSPPPARPSYREGRRNLSVWLESKAFNSFKAMVAEEGTTISDYMVEMINREFARKGRPQIARK